MTYDFEAHQAAAFLAAAYLRKGIGHAVAVNHHGQVVVHSGAGWTAIEPDFAMYTARIFWKELGQ